MLVKAFKLQHYVTIADPVNSSSIRNCYTR